MRVIRTTDGNFPAFFRRLMSRGDVFTPEVWQTAEGIVRDVASRGDEALFAYTRKFDGYDVTKGNVLCQPEELAEAADLVDPEDGELLRMAAQRIEAFHRHQRQADWFDRREDGVCLGQRLVPLRRVGLYVPGGSAAYPSTVLMGAIPARVAGVEEIVICTPLREGRLNPLIADAARICGIEKVYKVGGAQAVAAMAFGTESMPAVDKIVGPGNAFVAAAKKIVFGTVDIDMIAGPSEVLIIADGSAPASFAAADLLAQAEHDERASAVLITPDETYGRAVAEETARLLQLMRRGNIAEASIAAYGAVIITRDLEEAVDLADRFAPEHIEVLVEEPERVAAAIRNAGAVFVGPYTPETFGDYLAGPNHVLPTAGTARFASALGVYDFVKRISVLRFSPVAFSRYAEAAERFASLEGLEGHGAAIRVRREKIP